MNDQPEPLTDKQRDDHPQATAEWGATTQRMLDVAALAFRASAAQFADLVAAMRNAGRQDGFGLCTGGDDV
ncbi:hypothetical protein [Streptomyces xanthochromogenes]|uniref:Uncharacterized protein n=1 Tax=Streptomyces xanthochromogenes TaxID=67384 RepID=A0ABQ3B223_9ACTN|nr:hypothetical protein [Streptomyces xanthochromogenes]GGY71244.1 hypothetical protein GCM10010326_76770 [Streptomyces xanthochromogenes]